MLNITITEKTPHNMLRAIRAACNELLGDARPYSAEDVAKVFGDSADDLRSQAIDGVKLVYADGKGNETPLEQTRAQGGPVAADQFFRVGEQPSEQNISPELQALFAQQEAIQAEDAARFDSTGAEWNPELHASTKAKNQDGTWKKRRGAGKVEDVTVLTADGLPTPEMVQKVLDKAGAAPGLPPLPPTPPAPAAPLVTMNDIYALISGGKCVLNDVIAGAQAMGFADVGAFSRDATPEQRAQLLAQMTKEVA